MHARPAVLSVADVTRSAVFLSRATLTTPRAGTVTCTWHHVADQTLHDRCPIREGSGLTEASVVQLVSAKRRRQYAGTIHRLFEAFECLARQRQRNVEVPVAIADNQANFSKVDQPT